jgi:DNA-binding phage protein
MSGHDSDRYVAHRLADLRANLLAALAGRTLTEVAAQAGLEVEEVAEMIHDTASVDLFVLARVEAALGVPLWPRGGPPESADPPEANA